MKIFHKIIIIFHIIDFMKIIHKIDNKRKKLLRNFNNLVKLQMIVREDISHVYQLNNTIELFLRAK